MSKKNLLLLAAVLSVIVFINNSCKKQAQTTVSQLLSAGKWQLASVTVTYTNDLVTTIDTLNTTCDSTQVFTFSANQSCTYTNFDCVPQKSSGNWSLSTDQLTLNASMTCKDTTKAGSSNPFIGAQILNAGVYSLVLQTGDYNVIPTTTNRTRVVRYGFVHPKATN